MKSARVRDLRYHFTELEARLRQGEEIEIRRRKQVVGRLVPARAESEAPYQPDFAGLAGWRRPLRSANLIKPATASL